MLSLWSSCLVSLTPEVKDGRTGPVPIRTSESPVTLRKDGRCSFFPWWASSPFLKFLHGTTCHEWRETGPPVLVVFESDRLFSSLFQPTEVFNTFSLFSMLICLWFETTSDSLNTSDIEMLLGPQIHDNERWRFHLFIYRLFIYLRVVPRYWQGTSVSGFVSPFTAYVGRGKRNPSHQGSWTRPSVFFLIFLDLMSRIILLPPNGLTGIVNFFLLPITSLFPERSLFPSSKTMNFVGQSLNILKQITLNRTKTRRNPSWH